MDFPGLGFVSNSSKAGLWPGIDGEDNGNKEQLHGQREREYVKHQSNPKLERRKKGKTIKNKIPIRVT